MLGNPYRDSRATSQPSLLWARPWPAGCCLHSPDRDHPAVRAGFSELEWNHRTGGCHTGRTQAPGPRVTQAPATRTLQGRQPGVAAEYAQGHLCGGQVPPHRAGEQSTYLVRFSGWSGPAAPQGCPGWPETGGSQGRCSLVQLLGRGPAVTEQPFALRTPESRVSAYSPPPTRRCSGGSRAALRPGALDRWASPARLSRTRAPQAQASWSSEARVRTQRPVTEAAGVTSWAHTEAAEAQAHLAFLGHMDPD